jgi:hypothetical protein
MSNGAEDYGEKTTLEEFVMNKYSVDGMVGMEASGSRLDGAALLDELAAVMRRFAVLPIWGPETLALWTLHTYAYELRDVTAYLGLESPEKRCGKTTVLGILRKLVARPVVASNISPSAFFRVIEQMRPTLLIDEADTILQGNDQLRGILNAGYSQETAFVYRTKGGVGNFKPANQYLGLREDSAAGQAGENSKGKFQDSGAQLPNDEEGLTASRVARYSCWCPKVMAAIGRLPETLADRCVLVRMHRKRPEEVCERLRRLEPVDLIRRCKRFVAENAAAITGARPEVPEGLNDRAADIWEPMLALADLAGGEWPRLAREAATALSAQAQEGSPVGTLLFDLFYIFAASGQERVFSRDLVDGLNFGFKERPWMHLPGLRANAERPKVTEVWLARQLRPYGIRSSTLRLADKVGRGYLKKEMEEAFRRYVSRSELEAARAEMEVRLGRAGRNGE